MKKGDRSQRNPSKNRGMMGEGKSMPGMKSKKGMSGMKSSKKRMK